MEMWMQCWSGMAYPERRCPNYGMWKSPEHLAYGAGEAFVRAVRWCNKHHFPDDVPVTGE